MLVLIIYNNNLLTFDFLDDSNPMWKSVLLFMMVLTVMLFRLADGCMVTMEFDANMLFSEDITRKLRDAALNILNSWLIKCGESRQLDQNFSYMVRYALKNAVKNGYRPVKFDTLKVKNKALYDLLR